MTTTHIDGLDRTVHETNVWLKEICDEMGWEDRGRAYVALRGTLHTLRDRVTVDQAAHLAAQLPLLIAGVFWDGYKPAGKPNKARDLEELTSGVREAFLLDSAVEPEDAMRGVVSVMRRHVSEGEMNKLLEALPRKFADLLTAGTKS